LLRVILFLSGFLLRAILFLDSLSVGRAISVGIYGQFSFCRDTTDSFSLSGFGWVPLSFHDFLSGFGWVPLSVGFLF